MSSEKKAKSSKSGKAGKRRFNKARHRAAIAFLRPIARVFLRLALGFRAKRPKLPKNEQYVVLSNHNTDYDVVMLYCLLPAMCHFIASDHILKWKFVGKLIEYFLEPIPIVRAQMDLKAIRDCMECKKQGGSIGIFPEGGCSYTGRTGYISPATAKFVKQLGLPLYLFNVEGAFLSVPSFAHGIRKGKTTAHLRKVLSAEEIKAMSVEQLHGVITQELAVDTYSRQRKVMDKFRGKKLAEGLETVLYQCPKCGAVGEIRSEDDKAWCERCGYTVRYNEYGFFEGEDVIFDNLTDWDTWQRAEIVRCISDGSFDMSGQTPIYTDKNELLVRSEKAQDVGVVDTGDFYLYSDRFELVCKEKTYVWKHSDINKLRATVGVYLSFSVGEGDYYEIRPTTSRSSYKYMLCYFALKQYAKGLPMDFFGV
ncbi:MAG: 1-acyl-sn-glycerol-3-phosphate acyltransferase [Oscillospiraceae bacterium]|nr:1-acyl-sn-glycerol-3-phosphate acyltransferase [Oscillospiraceae bacterium]